MQLSTTAVPAPSDSHGPTTPAQLGPDRVGGTLDVYRAAREFRDGATALVATSRGAVRDQLDRASLSVLLNTAKGMGRRAWHEKARFYEIARGSAVECGVAGPAGDCPNGRRSRGWPEVPRTAGNGDDYAICLFARAANRPSLSISSW